MPNIVFFFRPSPFGSPRFSCAPIHRTRVGAHSMRPLPERRNSPRYVLSQDGKNQRSPGTGSEECKHSSRLPSDPVTGGHLPGAIPRIRRGRCSRLPPLPRRCRWLGNIPESRPAGREKTRLEPAAVGAGPDTAGGWYPPLPPTRQPFRRGRCPHRPAVNCSAKQHGTNQADPVGAAGPILRHARAQWPGRRSRSHSNFARRTGFLAKGAAKNGVLVPLPPWAKEPAAGAAELSQKQIKRERPERPLPCFVFRTGAEAKRSFAGNSFAYFSFQEK